MKRLNIMPDFGKAGEEFNELIKDHCMDISKIIYEHIKDASKQPLLSVISMCVLQGYINGCFDTINSEVDKESEYLVKLRTLLYPIQLILQDTLRKVKEQDGQKPDSGGRR